MIYISGYRLNTEGESCFKDAENYISVNCCGYEKYMTKNIKTFREHGRQDFQLLYIARGTGTFQVGGQMAEVGQGNVVIFYPGEAQQYAYQCRNTPEIYWVHFTGLGAGQLVEKAGLFQRRVSFIGVHDTCTEYFKKIIFELQLKSPLYEQTVEATLMQLLAYMGRKRIEAANPNAGGRDANIRKVVESLHTQSSLRWNIAALAKQCSLSPNHFMHKFKEQTGISALEYLIKIRMDKAKDLLLNSSLSIKEISNLVGYENPLYFSRLFSKLEGASPKAFRKIHR